MSSKYEMQYKLYTLVDITHTNQYRLEEGKEQLRWKEQNFNTVLQILGLRSNIIFYSTPIVVGIKGSVVGFDTDEIIKLWRFDFETERDNMYGPNEDPTLFLREDFHLVPYIAKLDELMEQNYAVFVTEGEGKNIVFHKKQ